MIKAAALRALMTVAIFILAATSQAGAATTNGMIDFSQQIDNFAYDTDLVDVQFGPEWFYVKNDSHWYLGGFDVGCTNNYGAIYIDFIPKQGAVVELKSLDLTPLINWVGPAVKYVLYKLDDLHNPILNGEFSLFNDRVLHMEINLQSTSGLRLYLGPDIMDSAVDNIAFSGTSHEAATHILSMHVNEEWGVVNGPFFCNSGTCSRILEDGMYTFSATADIGHNITFQGCDAIRKINDRTTECDVQMSGENRYVGAIFRENVSLQKHTITFDLEKPYNPTRTAYPPTTTSTILREST